MDRVTPAQQSGFSLIEVMIAMAIFAFGLLALAALQIAATKASSDAQYVTQANLLTNEVIGMMWGTPTAAALSNYNNVDTNTTSSFPQAPAIAAGNIANWRNDLQSQLPGGRGQITVNGSQVNVTVSWLSKLGIRTYAVSSSIEN